VPIAAWSDLLYSLIPNGRERESVDRPGGAKLSFINGLYLSGSRLNDGYDNYPTYFNTWWAWINTNEPNDADRVYRGISDGLAGYRSIWWQKPFWDAAAANKVPIFMAQGFTDDLFPLSEAKRMLQALQTIPGYPVAAYFGDIGHPRAANKPAEVDHVLGLIKQWLAFYLKGVGAAPEPGVYAAVTRPRDVPFSTTDVHYFPTLAALSPETVSEVFPDTALPPVLTNPDGLSASGVTFDPLVGAGAQMLPFLGSELESPVVPGSLATYEVPADSLPGGAPFAIAGQPTVALHLFTTGYRVQLNVRLFDVDGVTGTKRLVTRGTYTLENRATGVPIGDADVVIPTYGNLWGVERGHTLRLELTNVDTPYIAPSRIPSATTVTGVRLDLPINRRI